MTYSSNRKINKSFFLVLFLIPTLFFVTTSYDKGKSKDLKIGKKMPLSNRVMSDVDDENYALHDLFEKNGLVVVFSCNTCPFVVGNNNFEGWEKQYNELHQVAIDNNLGFVLVNSNEAKRDGDDSKAEMKKHHIDQGYSMKYLVDENSEIANAFGAKTTPHVFVFDSEAKLYYRGAIDNSVESNATENRPYLIEAIEGIAKNLELEDATTPPRGCSIKRK